MQPRQGTPLEHLALVTRAIMPLDSTVQLFYKATLSRPGDVVDLSNRNKERQANEDT